MFNNDETLYVLKEIRDCLMSIHDKLEDIEEECSDINSSLSTISFSGLYSIRDVCNKLDLIEIAVDNCNI